MTDDPAMQTIPLRPIGVVHSPYRTKDDVPKGLGAQHAAEGEIEIFPEFAAGLADIEGFSHLYLLWIFDRAGDYELLGRNPTDGLMHGVFATRSPRRPNPLALSVLELLGRDDATLRVRGVDMLDGSPIVDLKPYLSSVPTEKLRRGWLDAAEAAARSSRTDSGG
jgi:tRNA-Thr(GGU) m(6)t(6)A37 methyltransferase TsaA